MALGCGWARERDLNPASQDFGFFSCHVNTEFLRMQGRVFHDLNFMEREGSGFDKIFEVLLAHGRSLPLLVEGPDSVHVTIQRRILKPEVIGLIAKANQSFKLTQRERICLGILALGDGLTAVGLAAQLELPGVDALKSWLGRLLEVGLVKAQGRTEAARAAASIVLMTPGLSVIVDAIKESRNIFQRMNSYAIYRITETLRVLLFMTLSILVFNFYPVTAVMIVMLALLNDGAILSIAYDHVLYKSQPEAWDMRTVLGVSTVLGVIGVVSAFGLFYLGERVFHLDRAHIQTLMYLKLSVAGHLTIFLTRTRGPFWSIRPARILWAAVLGTQVVATLIAVYGVFMTPLGWGWSMFVWGYALTWFLLNDRVKLLAYWILERRGAPSANGSGLLAQAK